MNQNLSVFRKGIVILFSFLCLIEKTFELISGGGNAISKLLLTPLSSETWSSDLPGEFRIPEISSA